jgi:hypothetical protein
MFQQHYIKSDIKYKLLVSILGLSIILLLTAFPPRVAGELSWRKVVVGSIFCSICILGIIAVFSPNRCLSIFRTRTNKENDSPDLANFISHGKSNPLKGHHPTCGRFVSHIFRVKGKTYCAACVGLLFGGLLALVGASIYFFADLRVTDFNLGMILLGIVGISFGLFQFKFRNFIRLSVNIIFVLGALLILIGIDELINSLFIDLFVVSLIVFWLLTRISLSQWDHERICFDCEIEYCSVSG